VIDLVDFFLKRPVIVNVIMFGVLILGYISWQKIGKEEMPEHTVNRMIVSVKYPGSAAQDVESFITKPLEEKLKGLSGLDEVKATSAFASATISISFEANTKNLPEKVQEVKDAVDSVSLPDESEDPVYKQFKTSEKSIIDIGLYLEGTEILTIEKREELQRYALGFKNKILSINEVSGVSISGYLDPELAIKVNPKSLKEHNLSLSQVKAQILAQNVRTPIGSMKDKEESEISISSELNSVSSLSDAVISSGFEGQRLLLKNLATVENSFKESTSVVKIQGHEGVVFNIQKSTSVDILKAQKAIIVFLEQYKKNYASDNLGFVIMDDESYDVRNRISLIGVNGIMGFILIIIVLFLFLDFKSGIWVAMGIPFSLSITLICSILMGYTINNMTLASIIIVLGIVVDDAIIVAENMMRNKKEGTESVVKSVNQMRAPIVASVLTTCAAFIPLYFFSGRFGLLVKYIPAIIFIMLFASLIESFFILPSHMSKELPGVKFFQKKVKGFSFDTKREVMVGWLEKKYKKILLKVLSFKWIAMILFAALLGGSFYVFNAKLKYVMFPREESRDFRIKVVAPNGSSRYVTAKLVRKVEDIFINDGRNIVTSVRTSIGLNRRGGEVKENEASLRVEIVPASDRDIPLKVLLKEWKKKINKLEGFNRISFQKNRFGSDSGSPLVIQIQENNDDKRKQIANKLKDLMEKKSSAINIEIERPLLKQEYRLIINKNITSKLKVDLTILAKTLRSYIEGDILYTLNDSDEEVDVRFTSADGSKSSINDILELTVVNNENYLIPIKDLVKVKKVDKASNISRVDFKRTTQIYADIDETKGKTPLDIAVKLETTVFPEVLKSFPSANIIFKGEVEDSRESQSDFGTSIFLVLGLIYVLLVFLFNSFVTPILIGAVIPFSIVGCILAFWAHGMYQFGFFSVIGALGMIGVVINDSIVLLDKLESSEIDNDNIDLSIATISSTRLKAIIITTITTVVGLFPTAYGLGGYDSMLSEMMLAMSWGLLFGMFITLFLLPCVYRYYYSLIQYTKRVFK
jgi:multidrug efflux pump subunit AcrB